MTFQLDKIEISDFKRIKSMTIELDPITALVGSNTSGKSSALQAAQLGVSALQAAFKGRKRNGSPDFAVTVANDAVLYRPTEHLLDLRHGSPATQNVGYSILYEGRESGDEITRIKVEIKRGKNANIALNRTGDDGLASLLANGDKPFSIFTPGLSGIPMREEWHTKAAMDAAVMHGDANLYLRTVLDHLFSRIGDEPSMEDWKTNHQIENLPDCHWKTFSRLLDCCFEGARVVVKHDPQNDRHVPVSVIYKGSEVTLDMASTGMLQVIQILAYSCFYGPSLLLLDEPDAHLHADSQSRLYEALRGLVTETQMRVLFATHSPQMIQRVMNDPDANLVWMEDGALVPVDSREMPTVPLLMNLGALSVGNALFDPDRKTILLAEDKKAELVTILAKANGAPDNLVVLSYDGCANLSGARMLAAYLSEIRPDAQIFLHRDRDFRTKEEMAFELALAEDERNQKGVERVTELFTPLNDVEHSFSQIEHLVEVFSGVLERNQIKGVMDRQIARRRDHFIEEIRNGRWEISKRIYDHSRRMRNPRREEHGVPGQAPNVHEFLPADGEKPVKFQFCHGKKLLKVMQEALKPLAQNTDIDVEETVKSQSEHLKDSKWTEAFAQTTLLQRLNSGVGAGRGE